MIIDERADEGLSAGAWVVKDGRMAVTRRTLMDTCGSWKCVDDWMKVIFCGFGMVLD